MADTREALPAPRASAWVVAAPAGPTGSGRRHIDRHAALGRLAEEVARRAPEDEIYTRAVQLVHEHLDAPFVALWTLMDPESGAVVAGHGIPVGSLVDVGRGTHADALFRQKAPLVIDDLADPGGLRPWSGFEGLRIGGFTGVRIGDAGSRQGGLFVAWRDARTPAVVELDFLVAVAASCDIALRLAQERRQDKRWTQHDMNSLLPDMGAAVARAEAAIARIGRTLQRVVAIGVRVDSLRALEAAASGDAAEEVSRELAFRLRSATRPMDTVARWAVDTFMVICDDASPLEAEEIAERLVAVLSEPFAVGDRLQLMHVSAGIALTRDRMTSALRLAENANLAAEQASSRGESLCHYDATLHAMLDRRLKLQTEFLRAVELDQLILEPTALRAVADQAVVGYVFPPRWADGAGQVHALPPLTGSLLALAGVLYLDLLRATAEGTAASGTRYGLALPAAMLCQVDVIEHLLVTAREFPPGRIFLEIDQAGLGAVGARCRDIVHELRTAGIGIGLAGFGGPPAALVPLHEMPVDYVVLDLHEPGAGLREVLARAALDAGAVLVADGVDGPDEAARAVALGCMVMRGRWGTRDATQP